MAITLVKSVSDTHYPYSYPLELEDPYDTCERKDLKDGIFDVFYLASIKDYKIIEKTGGYDILFRLAHDYFHFTTAIDRKNDEPIAVSFLPEPKDRIHIHGAHRLKKKFRHAAKEAGVQDVRVRVLTPHKHVIVIAPNLDVYFDFWEKVPYSQRSKFELGTI